MDVKNFYSVKSKIKLIGYLLKGHLYFQIIFYVQRPHLYIDIVYMSRSLYTSQPF